MRPCVQSDYMCMTIPFQKKIYFLIAPENVTQLNSDGWLLLARFHRISPVKHKKHTEDKFSQTAFHIMHHVYVARGSAAQTRYICFKLLHTVWPLARRRPPLDRFSSQNLFMNNEFERRCASELITRLGPHCPDFPAR